MPKMATTITVQNATVKTATVEIKVLAVSGKQVTLAVFRQLRIEPVLDDATGELQGVTWGLVNYFGSGCEADHLHIVWQKGDELRRACQQNRRSHYQVADEQEVIADQNQAINDTVHLLAAGWVWSDGARPDAPGMSRDQAMLHLPSPPAPEGWTLMCNLLHKADRYAIAQRTALFNYLAYPDAYEATAHSTPIGDGRVGWRNETPEETAGRIAAQRAVLLEHLHEEQHAYAERLEISSPHDRREIIQRLDSLFQGRRSYEDALAAVKLRWSQNYRILRNLDQLFIAV